MDTSITTSLDYDIQSVEGEDPELASLIERDKGDNIKSDHQNKTPDPTVEKEVRIASSQDELVKATSLKTPNSNSSGSGSDQGRGSSLSVRESPVLAKSPGPQLEGYEGSSFRLKLSGLYSSPRSNPGSGAVSRKDSGCSTPLTQRSEQLEYPCLNFIQSCTPTPRSSRHEERMTIRCHYNPIMDEYISLEEEEGGIDVEKDTMFQLYKTDSPLNSSSPPTLNVAAFLKEFEEKGIQRVDQRINGFIKHLNHIKEAEGEDSINSLNLTKPTFLRCIEDEYEFISKVLKNQLIIPQFQEFCSTINDIYQECKAVTEGSVASYIPQLAKYSPDYWGVSICTVDGQRYSVGDTDIEFSLQSASKPFTYAICLNELGSEIVHEYVGQEPSGRMFNELSLDYKNKPHNPLLNSGAIMSSALLLKLVNPETAISEKFDFVWNYFRRMAGDEHIGFNNSIFLSERETADRNFALAYYMKENKCFPPDFNLQDTLDFYFQTCSMEVTCSSLSVLGATLANGGICPITHQEVLQPEVVRDVLSLMHSCGMYNYSGQFAFKVGVPAKSGVSGALVLVIPNVMGIGLWSPPLDALGNTVRGGIFAEKFIEKFVFHRFDNVVHLASKIDPRKNKYDAEQEGVMSLLYSATTGDLTAIRRFNMQGCNMTASDYDRRTVLHLAAAEGHLEVIKFLVLECGLDAEVKDRWGFTPLDEGRRFNHAQVVSYLQGCLQNKLPANLEEALSEIENFKV